LYSFEKIADWSCKIDSKECRKKCNSVGG